jgi:dolichol-phosphate mannosyltransferase
MDNRLCSICISLLNEEENIGPLYEAFGRIAKDHPDMDWEYVLVDDGSTDGTWNALATLHERDPRVKAVRLSRNFGAHEGTAAAIFYATGEALVLMGADLQDPPEVVSQFVTKWKEGYDIVWGVRTERHDHPVKTFLANCYYRLIGWASEVDIPRNTGSFCLLSRKVADVYNAATEHNRVTFELIGWLGFHQTLVPFERAPRLRGRSKFSTSKLFKVAFDSLFATSKLPIRTITVTGLSFTFLSLIWVAYTIMAWLIHDTKVPGWPSLMVAILLVGGLILMSLGITGEYLWRILDETRGRPLFVTRHILGEVRTRERLR